MLPVEFTCDGQSASPPIQWKEAPAGTKSFALSLWHTAPDQEKSYWLVYDIPVNVDQFFYLQFSFVTKPVRPRFSDRCGKFTRAESDLALRVASNWSANFPRLRGGLFSRAKFIWPILLDHK